MKKVINNTESMVFSDDVSENKYYGFQYSISNKEKGIITRTGCDRFSLVRLDTSVYSVGVSENTTLKGFIKNALSNSITGAIYEFNNREELLNWLAKD